MCGLGRPAHSASCPAASELNVQSASVWPSAVCEIASPFRPSKKEKLDLTRDAGEVVGQVPGDAVIGAQVR